MDALVAAKPEGNAAPGSPPAATSAQGKRRFARLLPPLMAAVGALKKIGRLGATLGGIFRVLPKSLAWAKGHKLVAIGALSVILVGGNGVAWWMLSGETAPPPPPETIHDALLALDNGEFDDARRIVGLVSVHETADFDTWGGTPFVLAVADLYEREQKQVEPSLAEDVRITALLQTAHQRGFPKGREAQGLYLLGRCLAQTGQFAAAREALESALKAGAPSKAVQLPLAEAWSVDPRPDAAKAKAALDAYLADPTLSDTEQQWGLIEMARQQLGQGDLAGCRKTLDSFDPAQDVVPASQLLIGRAALVEARALPMATGEAAKDDPRTRCYQSALEALRKVTGQDRSALSWRRLSMYFIGAGLAELGETDNAILQYGRLRKQFSSSFEALVAGLDEARLLRGAGRHDEAIGLMATVFRQLPPTAEIDHPHLPPVAPRERVRQDYDAFVEQRDYGSAIKLLNAGAPALGEETTWELKAAVYQRWGRSLLLAAEKESAKDREPFEKEGRRRMRQAGAAFQSLAKLRFSNRKYPEDLWNSAESFAIGRDFVHAAEQYRSYIQFNTPRRRAEALFGLAGALLADGRLTEALDAVNEAIRTYPRNPGVYAARLLAGRIYSELGDGPHAEEMLRANLDGGQLAPESNEWRDSLFALGTLLYREGRPAEALVPLNEAVRRWPSVPQAVDAYYVMAECCRQRGEQIRELATATSVPSERTARLREGDALVAAALEHYDRVRAQLEQRSDRELLPPIDQATLRNCYFGRGAMLQQLGRYEEAVQAYADATNRYQFAPEALDAYVQAAECLRRLNRSADARGTLEQAKVALARIAADADFEATTNHTRAEWMEKLNWLSENL